MLSLDTKNTEKIRKQKEEDDEFQRKWEKALGLKQYEKNSVFGRHNFK